MELESMVLVSATSTRNDRAVMTPLVRRALACLWLLSVAGCSHEPPLVPRTAASPEVRQLDVGSGTNAFIVMGERPILVDAGWGAKSDQLLEALEAAGVQPKDLALIILTHGHGDHAGGATRLREVSPAKVALGQGDVAMVQAGHNRPLHPMGALGSMIRGFSDKPFPAFTPDLIISGEVDLKPYGVDGRIIPMPGHTPGSLVVLLANGDALVGDMLRGGTLRSRSPTRHFFHDDCAAAESHIVPLAKMGARRFFVGHGGPIEVPDAVEEFKDWACPK